MIDSDEVDRGLKTVLIFQYWRVFLPALISVVLFGVSVFWFILPSMENSILETKREMIRELTKTAWGIMDHCEQQARDGSVSREQAKQTAKTQISALRYGPQGKDYFWINDLHPYMIMHPYRSDLDGQDLSGFSDPEGTFLFVDMVKAVRKSGSGYVAYKWQWKDDPTRIVPKISFVMEFKPWGWVIGTGIYIEDVKAQMAAMTRALTLLGVAVLLVVGVLSASVALRRYRIEQERNIAQEALLESTERNRAILEASPDPIAVYDIDGLAVYINPAFTRLFGWTFEELQGKRIDFLPEDQIDKTMAAIKDIYSGPGRSHGLETTRLNKSGQLIEVSISAAVYCDAAGKAMGLVTCIKDISRLQQAQSALRESELKFRSISASAMDAIVMLDAEGRCSFWNKSAEAVFGYAAEDVLGKNVIKMLVPESLREEYSQAFGELRQTTDDLGQGQIVELQALNMQGAEFPVEVSVSWLQMQGQWFILSMVRDITQRKLAESALKESEVRYRTLFDAAHDPTFLMKGDKLIDCNAKAPALFRCGKDDLLGYSPAMISPETQPNGKSTREQGTSFRQMAMAGNTQFFEWQFKRPDGTRFDSEVSMKLIKLEGESYLLATVRDISLRKAAEQERLRLATAIEQAAEDVIITDTRGNIQYVNPAFERITGYSRAGVLGKTPRLLKSGLHDKAFYQDLWATVVSGKVWTGRIANRRKDGKIIHEEATISPIRDASGNINGYVSLKRDITDQILLETRLRQAQKMEAIGTLAGGIAHDFNNILGAIIGFTEIAMSTMETDSSQHDNLHKVLDAAVRASDLVKQILTFSRQTDQSARPVAVDAVVKEVAKMLKATLPSTIDIHQDIAARSTVMGDPSQIHQVILNLCTNAAHAMRSQGGTLDIRLSVIEVDADIDTSLVHLRSGRYHKLSVSDSGHGMEKEIQERIFDPFFTTKQKGEGTGMGLSVVHGIVKSHGGEVTVYSEVGMGTTFNVYFPAMKKEDEEEQPQDDQYPVPRGNERILLVDDEEMLLEVGRRTLEGFGFRVTAKKSSQKAWELFQESPQAFDVVITDYTMPEMTGLELAKKMLAVRPEMPVILCTGFSEQATSESAAGIGIKRFIMKPFLPRVMAAQVREALDEST